MNAPPKPAAQQRAKATWTVYRYVTGAVVRADKVDMSGVTALVEIDANVVARTAGDACWHIAETKLKEQATSDDPPVLTASRNGTQHGLNEPRPYALKPTVERVR